jgi:hydrogenase maturation protein HypF
LLAVGGELKNTFCLARDRYAFLSHYIGDMENAEVFESFEEGIAHLRRLFRIQPERVAYDLHPGYYSTRYAKHQVGLQQVGVQHHHAHIAACMAENGLPDQQVIGVAWDGTGFGTDGMIWGSEFLVASYSAFERTQHLEYLPLPGGDTATRNPWRIAVAYAEALGLQIDGMPFLRGVDGRTLEVVRKQVRRRVNAPSTSSMGRLFDAVASLAGIRNEVTYEAQAAMELEALSRSEVGRAHAYPFSLRGEVIGLAELLSAVIADVRSGLTPAHIGARLHLALADMVVKIASELRRETGIRQVVLSGGVWQNTLLLGLTRPRLIDAGFTVLVHRQTPPNDGALALGQAAVANFAAL